MDTTTNTLQLATTIGFFVVFLVLSAYYFYKKSNDKGLVLLFFSLLFLVASLFNFLSFILPILFLLFFISLLGQYTRKHQLYQLLWSISMFMFFLTTLLQAIGQLNNAWDPLMLEIYYIFASFQVLLLGLGELYLLSKRNILTKNSTIWVIFVSGFFWMLFGFIYYSEAIKTLTQTYPVLLIIAILGIVVMLYAILDVVFAIVKAKKFQVSGLQYSHFLLIISLGMYLVSVYYTFTIPLLTSTLNSSQAESVIALAWNNYSVVRAFAPLFAVNGAMFIFIGSIYSYIIWQLSIRKQSGKFSFGTGIFNIYFAIGVLIFSAGGTISVLGIASILYISELIGGIFMYFGFLESDKISMDLFVDIITLRFLHKDYVTKELPTHP